MNYNRQGSESDHWLPCLVDLIVGLRRVKMPTEKLVEVVTADVAIAVDAEKRVNDSLVQIWKLKFGNKVNFLFRLGA